MNAVVIEADLGICGILGVSLTRDTDVNVVRSDSEVLKYRHQEFQFPLWDVVHGGTESEPQLSNGSHIRLFSLFILSPFTRILELIAKQYKYSPKGYKDMVAIQDLVLTF